MQDRLLPVQSEISLAKAFADKGSEILMRPFSIIGIQELKNFDKE